jgi:hypothetical protein
MADRIARLALYKQLLKAAADFPSIRRKDIIKEIKIGLFEFSVILWFIGAQILIYFFF